MHGSASCCPTTGRTVGDVIDTVVKLLPALLGIAIGFVLRRRGVADQHDADLMFRLIINVFLPALAFTALSRATIDRNLAIFPLAASDGHIPRSAGWAPGCRGSGHPGLMSQDTAD
jgi:hypothetical protein